MTAIDRILIFDADQARGSSLAALLEESQPWAVAGSVHAFHELNSEDYGPSQSVAELQAGLPGLLVVVEAGTPAYAFNQLAETARRHGIATLAIVDEVGEPKNLAHRVRSFDSWMALGSVDCELPGRVAVILNRVHQRAADRVKLPPVDSRFLAVVIHDLRTPLNVIGLTLRAITQTVPNRSAALDEDLSFLQDNSDQIKGMLELLSDYCKLMEGESRESNIEFSPGRFLFDVVEDRRERSGDSSTSLRLEIADSTPSEVALDPVRARLALKLAIENAVYAAGEAPIRLRSSGEADRWIIEVIIESPPPKTLLSMPLRADSFERLTGSPAERRGLDLAVAARISELFGGQARLVVEPNRRSTIILDWPRRLPDA